MLELADTVDTVDTRELVDTRALEGIKRQADTFERRSQEASLQPC